MFETVLMAGNRHSLLHAAERVEPQMVIVDLAISASQERHLLGRLRSLSSPPTVIIISNHSDPADVNRILADGARGLVLKCAAPTELLLAVREVLQGRRYVSPALRTQAGKSDLHVAHEATH